MSARHFESFRASALFCAGCGQSRPVTESLLRTVPGREIYAYSCAVCQTRVGTREVSLAPAAADAPVQVKVL